MIRGLHDAHRTQILRVTFAWHCRIPAGCASHLQIRGKCCVYLPREERATRDAAFGPFCIWKTFWHPENWFDRTKHTWFHMSKQPRNRSTFTAAIPRSRIEPSHTITHQSTVSQHHPQFLSHIPGRAPIDFYVAISRWTFQGSCRKWQFKRSRRMTARFPGVRACRPLPISINAGFKSYIDINVGADTVNHVAWGPTRRNAEYRSRVMESCLRGLVTRAGVGTAQKNRRPIPAVIRTRVENREQVWTVGSCPCPFFHFLSLLSEWVS
jgi:hypothetical protein